MTPPPWLFIHSWIFTSHLLRLRTKSFLVRFTRYTMGFVVMSCGSFSFIISTSGVVHVPPRMGRSEPSIVSTLSMVSTNKPLSFIVGFFFTSSFSWSTARRKYSMSLAQSSCWMVSRSRTGSTLSSTWITSSLSNARTT